MAIDSSGRQSGGVDAAPDLDFSRVGPGTLAGRYLRTFWQPVYLAHELLPGHAKPIRTLGEDFTLYRGEDGVPHAVAFRCAHRGTQLSTGWVEGDCIRCFYHGWKYDPTGQCVEQPAEAAGFASKVKITSYPVQEYLGLVFAYLGAAERGDTGAFGPPPLPRYPFLEDVDPDRFVRLATTDARPYSYRNRIENSMDPVHVAFVHRNSEFRGLVGCPTVSVEETEYGLIVRATRPDGQTRITQFEMPTILYIKQPPRHPEEREWRDFLAWRVPVDDENNRLFSVTLIHMGASSAPGAQAGRALSVGRDEAVAERGEAVLSGKLHIDDIEDDPNLVGVQDYVVQLGQGVIAGSTGERLARSDVGVIQLRQLYARELRALAEGQPLKQWTALRPLATTGVSA